MITKQCPRCGILSKDSKFIGSICEHCYISINKPKNLPDKITIYVCRECGANKVNHWGEDILEGIQYMFSDKRFGVPKITLRDDSVSIKYPKIDDVFLIPIKFKKSLCDECTRKFSGYYEAIVQLRGIYADAIFVSKFIRRVERITFIPRVEELKEGIDVYVGDKQAVRALLAALKLKPKVTHKLYGIKDGRKVYRTTFLIRD